MSKSAHTPGPWRACCDGDCECGFVSSGEFPVCKVTRGDWGDDYPAIRLVGESSLDRKAEAYMEQITYGSVSAETAKANARLIAAAPDLLNVVEKALDAVNASQRLAELRHGSYPRKAEEERMARIVDEFFDLRRAAIAKVEGHQP